MKRIVSFAIVLAAVTLSSSAFAQAKPKKTPKSPAAKTETPAPAAPKTEGKVKLDKSETAEPKADKGKEPKEGEKKKGEKTPDGKPQKPLRFDVVEIEGRLKSPQLVYFLRRVRAEFASGELGHRSFLGELAETRKATEF